MISNLKQKGTVVAFIGVIKKEFVLFFLFILVHAGFVFSQNKIIKSKGLIVSFNNRLAFFKTKKLNLDDFLKCQVDTGFEVLNNYKIERPLKNAKSNYVIMRYAQNDSIITDRVVLKAIGVEM